MDLTNGVGAPATNRVPNGDPQGERNQVSSLAHGAVSCHETSVPGRLPNRPFGRIGNPIAKAGPLAAKDADGSKVRRR
jgi:hypothetical protein